MVNTEVLALSFLGKKNHVYFDDLVQFGDEIVEKRAGCVSLKVMRFEMGKYIKRRMREMGGWEYEFR